MSLKVNLLGVEFENPLLPASGPSVGSLHSLVFFNQSKVGGIVTKTISIEGADVKKPCIVAGKHTVYNTELWSEKPLEEWTDKILPELKKDLNKPLIVCAGYTSDDFKKSIPHLDKFADFFEVSTHYGKDSLHDLVSTICSLTDKPVFIKLSPHVTDFIDFIDVAIKAGASGVVAVNSVGPGVCIDLGKRSVTIGTEEGHSWISGPAIKPIALQRVMTIRKHYPDLPLIACGGVASARDVLEFILAGADLVQMLSSALINGRQVYNHIVEDLPELMAKHNIESIASLRKTPLSLEVKGKGGYPVVDKDKCVLCHKCTNICPEMAMRQETYIVNDSDKCIRCGLCESRCPTGAISGVI
ncbi:4Fe-4S dicluster domain-containing protein [Acidaminobacter sp. JC074]|uniref:4Fe-4S binding protein n=1 Tax=Acidaminobacter sp. JC074 TaxID=2530199 RepID=UPI001F0ED853|nr:4Fe-4S binding protein [Acidaminobacter sp. JC074]MCH4889755.1 4Fe-4S dicluster domain-containing protein [Acidaminobacter sp. JC074]